VWLTSHLRDPQPEGERVYKRVCITTYRVNKIAQGWRTCK